MPPNPIRPFLRNALYSFSSCSRAIPVHHPQPQPHEPILKITRNFCFQTAQHRNYISEMHKLAFEGNIIRLLRNEIQYELERSPPTQVFLLTHFLQLLLLFFFMMFENLLVHKTNGSEEKAIKLIVWFGCCQNLRKEKLIIINIAIEYYFLMYENWQPEPLGLFGSVLLQVYCL